MNLRIAAMAAFALIALSSTVADAKRCDGFNGCRCGVTQARYFGLPLNYNGINLKRAAEWKRLPHTSLHVGAVMYRHGLGPSGHVSRVTAIHGGCEITVVDERGEHRDSACGRGNVFVDPTGGGGQQIQVSARSHKRSARGGRQQVAYYQANYNYHVGNSNTDRLGAGSVH